MVWSSELPQLPSDYSADEAYFWDGVAERKLLLRRCARCGEVKHPPVPMCPKCGGLEWQIAEASGRGEVHSWIVSHHPSEPEASSRIVAVVELVEGVRIVANLCDVEVSQVRNDMPVEVTYIAYDGHLLPAFHPMEPLR